MISHFLKINNNKAYFTESLISEINKKENERLEELQTKFEIEKLKNDIQIFSLKIKLAKLYYLI